LGAGNYSSSLEMVKAMFWENCAVVHKPHHLNEATHVVLVDMLEPEYNSGYRKKKDQHLGRETRCQLAHRTGEKRSD
jgi:hypothetical protein